MQSEYDAQGGPMWRAAFERSEGPVGMRLGLTKWRSASRWRPALFSPGGPRHLTERMTTKPRRPLEGMLVLDLGQIYHGPYSGLLLGFMGARVLKIESPEGDIVRRRKRNVEPYPLVMLNSNKESVILDLKHPEGKALFRRLSARADVLVENFAAGVMDRLGLGWDVLRKENPRLVYGSGTGFGLSGPYRDLPAMDLTIQAMSGIMNATGFPTGPR